MTTSDPALQVTPPERVLKKGSNFVIYPYIKRVGDILVSLTVILLMLPILLVIATWIKLDSKGPVLFRHKRWGKNKTIFTCYKFRTMSTDAPSETATRELVNAHAYITKSGKKLRRLGLDELPQLLNVLKGEMSLIGPRPVVLSEVKLIDERDKYGANAFLPGIGGWAQSNGRDVIDTYKKAKLDGYYAMNFGLKMDIHCTLKTLQTIFTSEGYSEGSNIDTPIAKKIYPKSIDENKKRITHSAPLVSIVTPVYNSERFISDTIDSVLSQNYSSWELILIDDMSTDSSIEIINKYKIQDNRIKLIKNNQNLGAAKSRNRGTEVAHGRYIAFLDADDLWHPLKLSTQVKFMEDNNLGFTYTAYEFTDKTGKPTGKKVKVPFHITYRQSLKNHIIWTSTVMVDIGKIHKHLLEMPNIRRGQDAATWWQILKHTNSAYGINEVLSYYRRSSSSLSANKFKAMKRTWYLFRKIEKLSTISSTYNFFWYAYNAVRKRV